MTSAGDAGEGQRGLGPALRRAAAHVTLGVLPVVAIVTMVWIANGSNSIAADFHNEIYPQAKLMLAGEDPYPSPGSDLTAGRNYIWPPLPVFVASPLTLLAPADADLVAAIVGLVAFMAALFVVGVRDWRVYGAAFLWPQVLADIRVAHYSLVLCLAIAIAWRMRSRLVVPGLTVGIAIGLKFFLWPLVLWLAALRRFREAAIACGVAAATLLLLIPFTDVPDYVRVLRELGATFDQDSYTPYGLLVQAGAPSRVATLLSLAVGFSLIALAWRRRSFALFVASSLVLSPIVWLDYFALLAIPLAVVKPRFGPLWLLPLLTWGVTGAGAGNGDVIAMVRVLGVFAFVVWYTARAESDEDLGAQPAQAADSPDAPLRVRAGRVRSGRV